MKMSIFLGRNNALQYVNIMCLYYYTKHRCMYEIVSTVLNTRYDVYNISMYVDMQ